MSQSLSIVNCSNQENNFCEIINRNQSNNNCWAGVVLLFEQVEQEDSTLVFANGHPEKKHAWWFNQRKFPNCVVISIPVEKFIQKSSHKSRRGFDPCKTGTNHPEQVHLMPCPVPSQRKKAFTRIDLAVGPVSFLSLPIFLFGGNSSGLCCHLAMPTNTRLKTRQHTCAT